MADENENVGLDPEFKGADTDGFERIDTSVLPPNIARVVEARLGRYHRQTKEGQKQIRELKATMDQMAKDNRALFDRLNARDAEEVKTGIKEAFEKGDGDKLDTLTTKLVDIKSKPAAEGPSEKSPEKPAEKPDVDLSDFMTAEEEALFLAWAGETGDDGPLRPWLGENHPKYKRAMGVIDAALKDDELRNKGAKAVMDEVDRMMNVAKTESPAQPQRRVASVLSGSANPPRNQPSARLSADQARAADLMGVTREAYAKSMAAIPKTTDGRNIYMRTFDGDRK